MKMEEKVENPSKGTGSATEARETISGETSAVGSPISSKHQSLSDLKKTEATKIFSNSSHQEYYRYRSSFLYYLFTKETFLYVLDYFFSSIVG